MTPNHDFSPLLARLTAAAAALVTPSAPADPPESSRRGVRAENERIFGSGGRANSVSSAAPRPTQTDGAGQPAPRPLRLDGAGRQISRPPTMPRSRDAGFPSPSASRRDSERGRRVDDDEQRAPRPSEDPPSTKKGANDRDICAFEASRSRPRDANEERHHAGAARPTSATAPPKNKGGSDRAICAFEASRSHPSDDATSRPPFDGLSPTRPDERVRQSSSSPMTMEHGRRGGGTTPATHRGEITNVSSRPPDHRPPIAEGDATVRPPRERQPKLAGDTSLSRTLEPLEQAKMQWRSWALERKLATMEGRLSFGKKALAAPVNRIRARRHPKPHPPPPPSSNAAPAPASAKRGGRTTAGGRRPAGELSRPDRPKPTPTKWDNPALGRSVEALFPLDDEVGKIAALGRSDTTTDGRGNNAANTTKMGGYRFNFWTALEKLQAVFRGAYVRLGHQRRRKALAAIRAWICRRIVHRRLRHRLDTLRRRFHDEARDVVAAIYPTPPRAAKPKPSSDASTSSSGSAAAAPKKGRRRGCRGHRTTDHNAPPHPKPKPPPEPPKTHQRRRNPTAHFATHEKPPATASRRHYLAETHPFRDRGTWHPPSRRHTNGRRKYGAHQRARRQSDDTVAVQPPADAGTVERTRWGPVA